jgi:3-oxoadipate CoA-transferase beta subunit
MDLVAGVKTIHVITQHTTKTGAPKLVESCTYPLTGPGVVDRVYTDLAVINVGPEGFHVMELAPGVAFEYVKERTGGNLVSGTE